MRGIAVVFAIAVAAVAFADTRPKTDGVNTALERAYAHFKGLAEGSNADYIPALAKVDPNMFGIALVTTDGRVYTAGDVKSQVSIQSRPPSATTSASMRPARRSTRSSRSNNTKVRR
jgi:glutaminase